MNDLIIFTLAVVTPFVLLVIFSAGLIAVGYLVFLLLTYYFERVRLDEGRKNKKLLQQIRSGRV